MFRSVWTSATVSLFLLLVAGPAAAAKGEDPLFTDNNILELRIEAPFQQLMRERPEDEYVPGMLSYTAADGQAVNLDVGLVTRGRNRRDKDICDFAPLRLNFKKSQTDNTVFDKQDKLKLVTHCQNNSTRYNQAVIVEYLVYRILNLLTDVSFRARLIQMTYADTDRDRDTVRYAFLIEHDDRFAKRIDKPAIAIPKTRVEDLEPAYTNLTSVFQFMVGNTDFSPVAGAPDTDCCHNHALFGNEGEKYYAVPYDFDRTGIVNAPHATPNPRFKLRSVKQRLYRGRCVNNGVLPDTLRFFTDNRAAITSLIENQPQLSKQTRNTMMSYIGGFYKTITNPKQVERQLVSRCL